MSSLTSRVGLYKPASDGSEDVDVEQDLNDNWDLLDVRVGFLNVTSSTRPAAPYNGQAIRETNTGKAYVSNGSIPASGSWVQIMLAGGHYDSDIAVNGSVTASGSYFRSYRAATTDGSFASRLTADANDRYLVRSDGHITWGGGSGAGDTTLYRSSANVLKTDDNLDVGGTLAVTGAATLAAGAAVTGNFSIGGARYQNQASAGVTLTNTTTETVLGSITVPANDASVGATYRIVLWGTANVTGTPTMTFRARAGSVSSTAWGTVAVVASSGVSGRTFRVEIHVVVTATGGSGSTRGFLDVKEAISVAGSAPFTPGHKIDGTGAVAVDTTISRSWVITGQWSAASVSNVLVAHMVTAERVS